jgi:uncharacterized protein YbjT (DUF2867 family)
MLGGTGMLGGKIARALLAKGDAVSLRVLVRKGAEDGKSGALVPELQSKGATMIGGDLLEPGSLDAATRDVDVVVSAVQGGEDVIIDGQVALANAAHRNGVQRIIPSDFAIDLFQVPADQHVFLGPRRRADEAIAAIGIEHVHVLNGAFMEVFINPVFGVFDLERGVASYWGDGDTKMDLTTTDDTARFVAEAALDPDLPNGKFAIAGDQLTMREAIEAVGEAIGHALAIKHLGPVSELERWIARQKATARSPMGYAMGQYQLEMETGRGKLSSLVNGRYPHIRPTTFREYLASADLHDKVPA